MCRYMSFFIYSLNGPRIYSGNRYNLLLFVMLTGIPLIFTYMSINSKSVPISTFFMSKTIPLLLEKVIILYLEFESLPEDSLGQKIRKARLYHGLTKRELAQQLNINEKTLRTWVSDKRKPVIRCQPQCVYCSLR